MTFLIIFLYTLIGTAAGAILSMMPSLHIYNVAGIALLIWVSSQSLIPAIAVGPFFMSMVVAFAFVNAIPMTLFGAADESASVTILPGSKYLMSGRGYEAVIMSGIGSLAGVFLLVILTPIFFFVFPYINQILSPHMHWLLVMVMIFMLMSEWPKGTGKGETIWAKFKDAWGNLFAGIITFVLSAIMGIILLSKSIISVEMGFQNIMPIFVGLFAMPSIIQALIAQEDIPDQYIPDSTDLEYKIIGKSAYQGTLGGLIAAYFPGVTAGIGGIMAGHATAQRGDEIFIVSGGIMKVIYYIGAFLFLFIITDLSPFGLGKGGLNMILKPVFSPVKGDYFVMISVILLSGCLSFLLLFPLTKLAIYIIKKINYHYLYWGAIVLVLTIIIGLTGLPGLMVMVVATFIGSIPIYYHCRRSNAMAVLLVPIALNMAGYGSAISELIGLL